MNNSIAVHNPEEIRNNPINNSTSKMLYSFPKGKRFPKDNVIDLPFYDLPDIRSKRTTSMGYGSKSRFEDLRKIPSPDKYLIKSQFDSKKNGPSFGISREEIKASSASMFKLSNVPGPGAYNPSYEEYNRSASITSRTKDHTLDEKIKVPGPGEYNTNLSTLAGRIMNSKYENIKCPVIPKSSSGNLKTPEYYKLPTPWSYDPLIITRKGDKALIHGKTFKFSQSRKQGMQVGDEIPGPGQYNCFSEFSR